MPSRLMLSRYKSSKHAVKRTFQRMLRGAPSSLTDGRNYRALCELAARDAAVFKTFRRQPVYAEVLEHVDRESGLEAIRYALQRHPEYRSLLPEFRRNDDLGGPRLEHFGDSGDWSATTLRYLKILSDLESLFGDLNGLHIVEIGAGYGGQCRLVLARFPRASYTIFDLPEPGALAARYLAALGAGPVAVNPPPSQFRASPVDLVISNYALSEIRRSIQQEYFERVVVRAARGYMLWNSAASRTLTEKLFSRDEQSYGAEEAASKIRGARVIRSRPPLLEADERVGNALILWGQIP